MDKRKGMLNVVTSIGFKLILTLVAILERRFLIQLVGNDVNGLNSLFASIIGFLSVAELGIGGAITFCMYKPIAEGKQEEVSALYQLFKKLYYIVGIIIFVTGIVITPFLRYLAKDFNNINQNVYLSFIIMLISVVLTYIYSARTSLINANKCDYITTTISSLGSLVQYFLQILVLIQTQSFNLYLVCRIVAVVLQWVLTDIYTNKNYKTICSKLPSQLSCETKLVITRSIKAAFMHKIGTMLVNGADSLIISAMIGVVVLGKFSNYTTIVTAMYGVIGLFFSPLTSVIGHCCVIENKENVIRYFDMFFAMNLCIGIVFFSGYYAVIDGLVALCFGNDLIMDRSIPCIVTVNYFVQFMRKSTIMFRDATGAFYYDRYKPIFEGGLNVLLSILLAKTMGVFGVVVATIITNLFICHVVEPYVLYKHFFMASPLKHYIKRYCGMLMFIGVMLIQEAVNVSTDNTLMDIIRNGAVSVSISILICSIIFISNGTSRRLLLTHLLKKKS